MIIQPDLWRQIEDRIREKRESEAGFIVRGGCKTLEAYADHVGYVRGLEWVLELAKELTAPEPEDERTETSE